MMTRLFTSECVSAGHPDKICDQISDAILDEALRQDSNSRVAVETAVKSDTVYILGEVTTKGNVDYDKIARMVLADIGYSDPIWGFPAEKVNVIVNVSEQSPEIGSGVDSEGENLGAGDQGIMFGYATRETPELMPLPITLARTIIDYNTATRVLFGVDWLGPDAKSQVTVRYDSETNEPLEIDSVVLSSVHTDAMEFSEVQDYLRYTAEKALWARDADALITANTKFFMNTAGPWHVGGPVSDAGLTGRKIIVDTYGGAARHGGGAFSGKDPTKVDRSAAYAARYLANVICTKTDRTEAEVQFSYAIGRSDPVSVHVSGWNHDETIDFIKSTELDFSLKSIIDRFSLCRPIYWDTARRGHFGRPNLPWEMVNGA